MPRRSNAQGTLTNNNGATLGYEAELWRMADALRGSMDAAEYKHVVLGLFQIHLRLPRMLLVDTLAPNCG